MIDEEYLVPLSSLQHWVYCPRQCGLIHLEQCWTENLFTAEGRNLHDKVHDAETESRGDLILVRGLRLVSRALGVVGQADLVEFHRSDNGCKLPGRSAKWQPFPVEFKRGKEKPDLSDDIQLCGQAACLEEMLEISINSGAIYYGRPRKRKQVELTATLRAHLQEAIDGVRILLQNKQVPVAEYSSKKCNSCSLVESCLPRVVSQRKSVEHYLEKTIMDIGEKS